MDSRYLLFLNTVENEYKYIDLFKNNLLTINKKVLSYNNNKDDILNFLDLKYNIILKNKYINILHLNKLPNLEISIDETKIKKHDNNIEEYNIKQISNDTEFNLRRFKETKTIYTPDINKIEYKYLILKNNNFPYYIDLKSENSLIRRILDKNVYSINGNELTLINSLINNINSTNITYDKSTLNETKYELKELLYFDCNTYEENLNKFIELFNHYYNNNNNEFVFINNNDEISLKFIEKFNFNKYKRSIYEYDTIIKHSYYLKNFILFNKDLWKYEIKGDNKITKDIFFEKIFNTNYNNSIKKNEITLTLKKENIIYEINTEINTEIKIENKYLKNYFNYIKQIFDKKIQEYCYFTIIIGNDKYRIKFTNIEDIIKEAYDKNLELTFKFFNDLIKKKYTWIKNDLRFINLLYVVKDENEDFFDKTLNGNFQDINNAKGGNKYNKYTLKELKQIAKKNKIKITKMVVISNDELHKKLKDKDIIINKKIKLEDFKRILMENNIKITKRVNLNKQELIKKLIN